MEDNNDANNNFEDLTAYQEKTLKINKAIRTCLKFTEKVNSIVPLDSTDKLSDGSVVNETLIYIKNVCRAEKIGNFVFIENLTESNEIIELLRFYVVFEEYVIYCTVKNSKIIGDKFQTKKYRIKA
ncbi:hypothetical protein DSCO28_63540 [Desulfosarcina ovata subsp. sediminis]|uniref:Uncharacterized protein n=1 Tax=Desulfosarcina ovata subsp. sediminis TaxID=885957 RepID=A0A5K8A013_9BACT|nr:hypothetical protein [Desulfosarcina ovata]BBO85788.1 hypothetical protein DSCO28_63540 [Desulfosarcina ovata subsp. sediminis]